MGPLSWLIVIVAILLGAYYLLPLLRNTQTAKKDTVESNKPIKKPISKQKFLDFDEDCEIRTLRPSDLNDVKALVKSDGGCKYFVSHSLSPFILESNELYLSFGVVYKPLNQIICTQFILMIDDKHTGYVLGAMINNQFINDSRIIYMRLSQYIQNECCAKFNKLSYHRTVKYKSYESYLNSNLLDVYTKFNVAKMDKMLFYLLEINDNTIEIDNQLQYDYNECNDINMIQTIFQNEYDISNLLIDWKIYQIKYLHECFSEMFSHKLISIMISKDNNSLCIIYGDHDYYVYSKDGGNALQCCNFIISLNTKNDNSNYGIFINKILVDSNDELKKLFNKSLDNPIIAFDYDIHIDGH